MRAATGAISAVQVEAGRLRCHVLGNVAPRGICGSGLVDGVAAGLDLGLILPSGRLSAANGELTLAPPVSLTQSDIRELQLAKGAIAAGIRILLQRWGAEAEDLTQLYLAGAFGNYINRSSAQRIGLIAFPPSMVQPAGNTALLGSKLALFNTDDRAYDYASIRGKTEHVSLHADSQFQEIFVEEMKFPEQAPA
jgi:uncharacterized 2Fe-2S/4Fe-4S cluster protein (DUF4445 family)